MFVFTSRKRAIIQAKTFFEKYLMLAYGLTLDAGQRSVEVPPMPGVDEDMRRWLFFMILEHNTIVNRSISINPHHIQVHYKPDFILNMRPPLFNPMPFLQTSFAACDGRMLGNEYGMPFHLGMFR
jgi:hypothetical protein